MKRKILFLLLILLLAVPVLGTLILGTQADEVAHDRPWRNRMLGWFGKDPAEPTPEKMRDAVLKEIEINRQEAGGKPLALASGAEAASADTPCVKLPTPGHDLLGEQGVAFREVPGQSVRILPLQEAGRSRVRGFDRLLAQFDFLAGIDFFARTETPFFLAPGQTVPALRYALTPKGYANLLPGSDCLNIGQREFDGIERITRTEEKTGNLRVYEVRYRARVKLAEWSKTTEALQAFPEILAAQEDHLRLVKVLQGPEGWIPISEHMRAARGKQAALALESGDAGENATARHLQEMAGERPEIPSHETLHNMLMSPYTEHGRVMDLQTACFPLSPGYRLDDDDAPEENRAALRDDSPLSLSFFDVKKRSEEETGALKNRLHLLEALRQAGFAESEIFQKQIPVSTPAGLVGGQRAGVRYTFLPEQVKILGLDTERSCVPLGKARFSMLSVTPQGLTDFLAVAWGKIESPSEEARQLAQTLPALKVALEEGYPVHATIRLSKEGGKPFWKIADNARILFPELHYAEFPDPLRLALPSLFEAAPDAEALLAAANAARMSAGLPSLPDGRVGLTMALSQKLVRRANNADIDAWTQTRLAASHRPKGNGALQMNAQTLMEEASMLRNAIQTGSAYVVLKPFHYPAGLQGTESALFLVPQGVAKPLGNAGQSSIMDFNTLTVCSVRCSDAGR
ncbi:MAG: hypothetical protein LBS89_04335 [Zoogloeaceae bacterium]|nr:hypothetical protein [Zoogloeaceae bacterium]